MDVRLANYLSHESGSREMANALLLKSGRRHYWTKWSRQVNASQNPFAHHEANRRRSRTLWTCRKFAGSGHWISPRIDWSRERFFERGHFGNETSRDSE